MNSCGPYVDAGVIVEPTSGGSLKGLEFAVKDVFHIQGRRNTVGNPDWYRTHGPAVDHAEVLHQLLAEGARLRGVTHTDELMYSLNGVNHHYGTPVNPKDPNRIPGGSSSGSATAVASGRADFALGTDTGGSVRIPSAFCGLYGYRPSHGAVSLEGVVPLAPSFDTVGWMAQSAELLARVGSVLLPGSPAVSSSSEGPSANCPTSTVRGTKTLPSGCGFQTLYLPKDGWALAYREVEERLMPAVEVISSMMRSTRDITLSEEGLFKWMNTFRILQGLEIWASHGEWIRSVKPSFGPGIGDRLEWASRLVAEEYRDLVLLRSNIQEQLAQLLAIDGLLILPTAPGPAPLLKASHSDLELYRERMLCINCIAGLSGIPQVHIPLAAGVDDFPPIGLSLLAGRGRDHQLLAFAQQVAKVLRQKRH